MQECAGCLVRMMIGTTCKYAMGSQLNSWAELQGFLVDRLWASIHAFAARLTAPTRLDVALRSGFLLYLLVIIFILSQS